MQIKNIIITVAVLWSFSGTALHAGITPLFERIAPGALRTSPAPHNRIMTESVFQGSVLPGVFYAAFKTSNVVKPLVLKKQVTPDAFLKILQWDFKLTLRISSTMNLIFTYS